MKGVQRLGLKVVYKYSHLTYHFHLFTFQTLFGGIGLVTPDNLLFLGDVLFVLCFLFDKELELGIGVIYTQQQSDLSRRLCMLLLDPWGYTLYLLS